MHLNDDKWNYIPCNFLKYEIKAMLNHHSTKYENK